MPFLRVILPQGFHFYSLSYRNRKDYARGGYVMVSTSDPTGSRTATLIASHSAGLCAIPALAGVLGVVSPVPAAVLLGLHLPYPLLAAKFWNNRTEGAASSAFMSSNISMLVCTVLVAMYCVYKAATRKEEKREPCPQVGVKGHCVAYDDNVDLLTRIARSRTSWP